MRSRHFIAALLLAALASSCGGSDAETVEFSETIDRVVVTAGDGRVSIVGDSEASVTEVQTTPAFSGEEPSLSVTVAAGVLTIDDGCGNRDDCEVEILVTLPATVDIEVTTVDGAIVISDTVGSAAVETVSGAISLNGIEGDLEKVATESGSVLGARLEGAVANVTSGSGDVDITFDEPVQEVVVITGDGNATVQVAGEPYRVITTTQSGEVDVVVDQDDTVDRIIDITTGSGDIKVYRK